ncbi:hypothetical protein B0H11DRAFT_2188902 [Mycena galericulata]|nr:hypothetical protein B0H11DRAFT_2188902 [Mycena galericulata]
MPDPNPDKFGEIFALPLCQIPTNLPKIGRRPVANPDKNDAPESDKFDRFWGLGLCQSRQIWSKSTNFRPDKWASVGTGIWWHNPGSSRTPQIKYILRGTVWQMATFVDGDASRQDLAKSRPILFGDLMAPAHDMTRGLTRLPIDIFYLAAPVVCQSTLSLGTFHISFRVTDVVVALQDNVHLALSTAHAVSLTENVRYGGQQGYASCVRRQNGLRRRRLVRVRMRLPSLESSRCVRRLQRSS